MTIVGYLFTTITPNPDYPELEYYNYVPAQQGWIPWQQGALPKQFQFGNDIDECVAKDVAYVTQAWCYDYTLMCVYDLDGKYALVRQRIETGPDILDSLYEAFIDSFAQTESRVLSKLNRASWWKYLIESP